MRSPFPDPYLAARARVENQIIQLAKLRRISVSVEVVSGPEGYQIQLRRGRSTGVVAVDHETFMNEEFFRTLVLHQLQAAIEKLATSA
jgi:alpha-glucuronidase